MNEQPWYREGLRFECTGCGDCCTGAPGFVWVNKAEIEALAAAVAMNIEHFERKYVRKVGIRKSLIELRNGDCVFFDSKSRHCEVYGARPRQCRTWPFWESNLQTSAAWQDTVDCCPGCNHGHLYPLEEIERRVRLRKV